MNNEILSFHLGPTSTRSSARARSDCRYTGGSRRELNSKRGQVMLFTSLFHACASQRRRNNRIRRLRREDGVWVEENEMCQYIAQQYRQLFQSQGAQRLNEVIERVQQRVSPAMNAALLAEYTEEEVTAALNSIGDLKAPGPDGMSAIFFKRFWDLVGDRVKNEVMTVLNGGDIPIGWNDTTVVLIPKVKDPQRLKDLRPISLCNVLYKIISKVLANRLKGILDEVISINQSAFVPGRLITDNILVAYEMTHFLQNKRQGNQGYMALKLDMSKAYDRVEWDFVEAMLHKLGFHADFVGLLMRCVRTVKYRIKVNHELTEEIVPQRGLRQGDPLSPYLFLICAEGFSSLMHHAEINNMIQGIKICEAAPSVSHLLFADDSLILMRASEENAQQLQSILELYESVSGQMINKEKSAIMFSKNTSDQDREAVKQVLELNGEARNEKYLGLPVYVGQSKNKAFEYIKERIWARIQGWKEKLLSMAGKEILIKAVAQAIPTYAMSCFDLTKSFCDQVRSMICRYWWCQQDKDKMHWLAWDILKQPKREGGLGFRDLHAFNLAMLAKQGWRLLQNPDSLCAQIMRAKYYPDGNLLQATAIEGMSYTWRSVLKGLDLIKKGIIWRIGDGRSVHIWNDPWIPRGLTRRPSSHRGQHLLQWVSDLIDPATGHWDVELVKQTFHPDDVPVILGIPLVQDMDDFIAWHFDGKGVFTVKSAYKVCIDDKNLGFGPSRGITVHHPASGTNFPWFKIWELACPNKVQVFAWRLAHNSLPLKRKIESRRIELDTRCPMCFRFDEDAGHLLFKCKFAKHVWRCLNLEHVRVALEAQPSAHDVFHAIWSMQKEMHTKIVTTLWMLWSERNAVNAGEGKKLPETVAYQTLKYAVEFQEFFSKQVKMTPRPVQKWKKPARDYLKLNVDGAFFESTSSGGWGFIIRDHDGEHVGSGAGHISTVREAIHTEAQACLQAVYYAIQTGMQLIELETDCLTLQSALTSNNYDASSGGLLFREIKFLLHVNFIDVKVLHVPRNNNRVAHKLASIGASMNDGHVNFWPELAQIDVIPLVADDLMSASS